MMMSTKPHKTPSAAANEVIKQWNKRYPGPVALKMLKEYETVTRMNARMLSAALGKNITIDDLNQISFT
jgi:hypothetical protein